MARRAENDDIRVLPGNALDQRTLETAGIKEASTLLIAIPEGFEAGAIFQRAQELNPDLRVIARANSDAEVQHLDRLGVPDVITGEREVATRMLILSAESIRATTMRPVPSRSEASRVGKECVSPCGSRWSQYRKTKIRSKIISR